MQSDLFICMQRKHRKLFQELAAENISKSLSITYFGRTACSLRSTFYGSRSCDSLIRGLVCYCLFLSLPGNHIPLGGFYCQMSLEHGIDGPGTLVPLFSAPITALNSLGGLIHGTEYLHLMQVFLMCFPEYCHHFQMNQGQSRMKDGKLG